MSKYKAIKTQITDPVHICQALSDMAVPYEAAVIPDELVLQDWMGQDTRLTAKVVVRRQHLGLASNDLGWTHDQASGTYTVQTDDIDEASQHIMEGVNQRCALLKLQELATLNGFDLEMVEDDLGVQRVLVGGVS